jgi:flavin-dependent dehydrogenase
MSDRKQIVVIGGGPAGATAAVFLRQRGYRPLILERAAYPRFHVGESLLPASQDIWDRMGLADELQHSRYEYKLASTVRVAPRPDSEHLLGMTFRFTNVPRRHMPFRPYSYQVERARFDEQLLDFAVRQGAELCRASVTQVLFEGTRATGVAVRYPDGGNESIEADFVIDASGRRAVIARQLGLLELDPVIQTSACFGHFENVRRDSGQGFFEAYLIENGWVWLIPFVDNRMSVGLIQNRPEADAWSNNGEEVLLAAINRYRWLQERFTQAKQLSKIRMLRNLAYRSRQFTGDGWLAIGDACFFIDPLFSTGVHVGLTMGEEAAGAIDAFLKGGRNPRPVEEFDRRFSRYRDFTTSMVRSIYRVLRSRLATNVMVGWCGWLRKDFQSWMLRRFTYWLIGNYESYPWVMRWIWLNLNVLALAAPLLSRLTGRWSWDDYRRDPFTGEQLRISKVSDAAAGQASDGESNLIDGRLTEKDMISV